MSEQGDGAEDRNGDELPGGEVTGNADEAAPDEAADIADADIADADIADADTDSTDEADAATTDDVPAELRARAAAAREAAADRTPGRVPDNKKTAKQKAARKAAPTTADDDSPATPAKQPRQISVTVTGALIGKILLGLLTIALLVLVIIGGILLRGNQQKIDAFEGSRAASSEFITAFIETANADSADQYKERLGPLSTGEFREKLEQQRTETEAQVEEMQISASGDIKLATVESFTEDTATTSVLVEVTATGASLPTPQRATMIYVLTLYKEDGEWLVAKLEPAPGTSVVYGGEDSVLAPNDAPAPAPAPQPGG